MRTKANLVAPTGPPTPPDNHPHTAVTNQPASGSRGYFQPQGIPHRGRAAQKPPVGCKVAGEPHVDDDVRNHGEAPGPKWPVVDSDGDEAMSIAAEASTVGEPAMDKLDRPFVAKLRRVLDNPTYGQSCTWYEDGFRILNEELFANTAMKSICGGLYTSFTRQLSNYGFKKRGRNLRPAPKKGRASVQVPCTWYHESGLFKRDEPEQVTSKRGGGHDARNTAEDGVADVRVILPGAYPDAATSGQDSVVQQLRAEVADLRRQLQATREDAARSVQNAQNDPRIDIQAQTIIVQMLIIAEQHRMIADQQQNIAALLSAQSSRVRGSKPPHADQSQHLSPTSHHPPAYPNSFVASSLPLPTTPPLHHDPGAVYPNPIGISDTPPYPSGSEAFSFQDGLAQAFASQISHAPTAALLMPPPINYNSAESPLLHSSPQDKPDRQTGGQGSSTNIDNMWSAGPPPLPARSDGALAVPQRPSSGQGDLLAIPRNFWNDSIAPFLSC